MSDGLHLGNVISSNGKYDYIRKSVIDLYTRYNILSSRFSFCYPDLRYQLFKTYCVVPYGSQLWDFSNSSVAQYFTAWRKCVRKLWGLSPRTHGYLLPGICDDNVIEQQLHNRSLNFVRSCLHSTNSVLRICINRALNGSHSAISNTMAFLRHRYYLSSESLFMKSTSCIREAFRTRPEEQRISQIRDFAITRHSSNGEDMIVLDEILEFLCT